MRLNCYRGERVGLKRRKQPANKPLQLTSGATSTHSSDKTAARGCSGKSLARHQDHHRNLVDQARSSQLAKEGFDLWQAGHLEAAVPKYIEALELADPTHYGLPAYLGEFGNVLSALGRDDEALTQFSRALKHELLDDPEGQHAGVDVATYFLAEHLMKLQRFAEA